MTEGSDLSPLKKMLLNQLIDKICNTIGDPAVDEEGPFLVSVPGDKSPWVVFGSWSDGTLDIIRRDAAQSNILWGWSPGQSVSAYNKELKEEGKDEPEIESPTRPYPLWDVPKKRR